MGAGGCGMELSMLTAAAAKHQRLWHCGSILKE
jgi:hypothetical protein